MELRPQHQFDPFGPGAAAFDDDDDPSFDFENLDYNNPQALFKALGLGGPGSPAFPECKSPAEVRQEAKVRSENIFTSYETLHEILKRHEASIRKRWVKRTRPQRLKILLSAWPNMPETHRPDYDAFRKESRPGRGIDSKYRQCFMWPYINQEDLLDTKTLPLLLNSRGRHPPPSFAGADVQAMHLGFVTKAIVPTFLNQYVMILNGVTHNSSEYGKLVAWSEHPDAFDWMSTLKQFLPGEGLLVLEAQERLLKFLLQCCFQLLHDIPESTLTNTSFPVLPEPDLKPESEITGFESLGVMAAESPYRVPAQLNLHHVESLLAARASAAEDHLWALREDPGYFSKTLLEAWDHRQELLYDLDGNRHPVFRRGPGDHLLWTRVIGTVVSTAYLELELFSELSSQAKNLVSLQKKHTDNISPLKDLPEEYEKALIRFNFFLNQGARGPLSSLKSTAVASPPLRKFFARQPPPDAYTTKIVTVSRPDVKMDKVEGQLLHLLRLLMKDGHELFLATLPIVVDELDRLLQSSAQARDLLSSYVTSLAGDISILSQCMNQLGLYHPWSRTWETKLGEHDDDLRKDYIQRTNPWGRILTALGEKTISTRATSLGEPSGRKFDYPVQKRRTKENVEALRTAEAHLDAFWASIDQTLIAKAGDLRGTAVRDLLSQPRILQRTREWVEPEKSTVSVQKKGHPDLYSAYQSFSTIFSDLPGKEVDAPRPKTKVKTRGTPKPPSVPVTEFEALLRPNPADQQPTFSVDARALKVFRTIFFNPAMSSTPGEVPWNDFLHAMTSVGFAAMKLYGSA
ncbi:hypothetical protein N7504_001877 [Penicillium tannophilum]|nr:hypothetical protein N7504_001877 [Penicillium tannophilum]